MARVILFIFGGRRANIELALPFYRQILADHPNTEIHLWDLCRNPADSHYLRTITGIDRLTVRTEFYTGNTRATVGQNRVWKHYTGPEYRDTVFVKADDDVIFYDTDRFGDFVDDITADAVTSALVVNNGAGTRHIPDLWDMFEQMGIPLLDVHLSADYATQCHDWFLNNWADLIAAPARIIPTDDWVSINCIGYTWATGKTISHLIGVRTPYAIAGRTFTPRGRVGDEGAVNMLTRRINTAMAVSHFTFGPQKLPTDIEAELRARYADVGAAYLNGEL